MRLPWMSHATPLLLWEVPVFLILTYLFLHPPMAQPQALGIALGGGLFLLLFHQVPHDAWARIGWAWWSFLAYLTLSAFWSWVPGLTLQGLGMAYSGTFLYLLAGQQDPGGKKRLETFVLFLGVGAALWAFYQWAWGFDELKFQLAGLPKADFQAVEKAIYYRRPTGPLTTTGSLAALLLMVIPLGGVLAKSQGGSKARTYGALTLLLLSVLGLTQSVGAWAGLVLAVVTILFFRREWKWLGMILGFGILAIGGVLAARGWGHWTVSSFGMRSLLWSSAWKLFLQHPLFGTGLGSFDEAYQRAGFSLVEGGARYPHDLILQLLCETGSAGTVLALIALWSWLQRLRTPSRWEGWGVGTGILAVLYFSLFDLPFQMPELVWVFALLLGRLELKPEAAMRSPKIPSSCVKIALLVVLGVTGLWPPFRPANFAILATALWMASAFFRAKFEKVPLLFFLGGAYLFTRAFNSPSALGTVRCLEMAGLALAFSLFLKGTEDPKKFLAWFMGLGFFFGAAVWVHSFRSSDIRDWTIFPNPKQVGTFLVVGTLLGWGKGLEKDRLAKGVGSLFTVATLVRLKAFGAMAAAAVGAWTWVPRPFRWGAAGALSVLMAAILFIRGRVFQDLDLSPTQWDRLGIWAAGFRVWLSSLWVGVGPGAFAGLYHAFKGPRTNGVSRYLMDAQFTHNEFLECLVAFGLVGVLFALAFLAHLWSRSKEGQGAALAALGSASWVDFCLHTPLILLQAAGLFASQGKGKEEVSWAGALLAGGMALGLFGSAAMSHSSLVQAMGLEKADQLPQALRALENAEKEDPWDARFSLAKGDLLEGLYLSTGSPDWRRRADEAYDRALSLEVTEGPLRREVCDRLIRRVALKPTPEDSHRLGAELDEAERQMPFDAFLQDEKGRVLASQGRSEEARACFQKAVVLEPNFALAWVHLGKIGSSLHRGPEAKEAFVQALQVHDRWATAERIAEPEKELVSLPPDILEALRKGRVP